MRKLKRVIFIIIIAFGLATAGHFSDSAYTVLNLNTGKATAEHKMLGVTYRTFGGMHNPSLCPTWDASINTNDTRFVSYSCYKHFSTNACITDLKTYQETYNLGCGINETLDK